MYTTEIKQAKRSQPVHSSFVQPKLKIGAPNDKYEQEADRIANRVVNGGTQVAQKQHSESVIQRKCTECEEEKLQIKPLSEQVTPLIQAKSNSSNQVVASSVSSGIQSAKGSGKSIDRSTKNLMERQFGNDFSNVNIHTGNKASQLNQQVNARAFTVGDDIFFNKGEYQPSSKRGKHLLAHELTHTLQQKGTAKQINRTPNPNPPPTPYAPGRPAHNHTARGVWPAVQANAQVYCAGNTRVLPGPFPIPIPPTSIKGRSECACAVMTPLQVLNMAKTVQMAGKPLAQMHLQHYISGGGTDYVEHTNLDNLLANDSGAVGVLDSAIASADSGHVFIRQGDYTNQDYRLAFGGIDRVDYLVDRPAGTVDVWFKDRYDFHPARFGYSNKGTGDAAPPGRPTNCVHVAAVEAKSSGAADYWMYGHVTVPLSTFIGSSSSSSSSSDL